MAAQVDFCLFLNAFSVLLAIRCLKICTFVLIKVILIHLLTYFTLMVHILRQIQKDLTFVNKVGKLTFLWGVNPGLSRT